MHGLWGSAHPLRKASTLPLLTLRLRIALAFLSIYTIWGSTYLAIRFAIETFPPFLMAAIRFLIAGGVLYAWMRLRGAPRPTWTNWKAATIIGGLLLLGGNGLVSKAELVIPSGLTAVLITIVPIWMALVELLRKDRIVPTPQVVLGLVLGFGGVVLLVGPGDLAGSSGLNPLWAGILIFAAFSWATGSVYSRKASSPREAVAGEWDGDASRRSSPPRGVVGLSGMGRFPGRQCDVPIPCLIHLSHCVRFSTRLLIICLGANKDNNCKGIHVCISQPRRGRLPRLFPCGRTAD